MLHEASHKSVFFFAPSTWGLNSDECLSAGLFLMQKKKVGKADDVFFFIINIQVSAVRRVFPTLEPLIIIFFSSLSYLTFVCLFVVVRLDMVGIREH